MNFYASAADGGHGDSFSLIHPDSHFPDAIVVPNADLLIHGSYHRSGLDLVLTGPDGQHHVIAGYFANEHPPALAAPDGAHFSADMVELLAGSPAPHEYAQAQGQAAAAADSIAKIQKVSGEVTVQRNGVSVALNVGDVVYKSDVIVTGTDAKCGLTFPDGTALELLPNTRMALNEYDYDPKSNSNQALFTLAEGTFGFVAGKVAHTGDMKIATPVATMGIRGTTGVVQEVGSPNGATTYSYSIYDDPGTTTSGSWDMFVDNPDGTRRLIATVSQTGYVTFVTPQGVGLPPLVSTMPLTASQLAAQQLIVEELYQVYGLGGPHSIGIPGSGDNPLLQVPPNLLPELFGNGPNATYNFQPNLPPGPAAPQNPQNPIIFTATTTQDVFIWSSANNQVFPNGSFWNLGASPTSPEDIVVILTGMSQYNENFAFHNLTIDGSAQNGGLPPGELDMTGGTLTVTNGLDVAGTLVLQGDPPTFTSYGTSIVEGTGEIVAQGAGTVVEFMPDPSNPNAAFVLVSNFGLIAAESGGAVEFFESLVTNEAAAASGGESMPQPGLIEFGWLGLGCHLRRQRPQQFRHCRSRGRRQGRFHGRLVRRQRVRWGRRDARPDRIGRRWLARPVRRRQHAQQRRYCGSRERRHRRVPACGHRHQRSRQRRWRRGDRARRDRVRPARPFFSPTPISTISAALVPTVTAPSHSATPPLSMKPG